MECIATTIIRHTPFGRPVSGRIFHVDLANGAVLREKAVPPPLHPLSDDNPRGGARGGRGAAVRDGRTYIANYDSIFVYDKRLKPLRRITNPLFAGLHEIEVVKDGIWVASTWLDLLLKVDFEGRPIFRWYYRDAKDLLKKLKWDISPVIDFQNDYRKDLKGGISVLKQAHINSVRLYKGSEVVVTFGQRANQNGDGRQRPGADKASWGYVVMLNTKTGGCRLIYKKRLSFPMHNGQMLSERFLLLNDSHRMENLLIDIKTKRIEKRTKVPGTWLRGLAVCGRRKIIVGSAPAGIYEIDLEKSRVVRFMLLSKNPNEAIHGLCMVKPR